MREDPEQGRRVSPVARRLRKVPAVVFPAQAFEAALDEAGRGGSVRGHEAP